MRIKLKNLIAISCAAALLAPAPGFADALRFDPYPRGTDAATGRARSNDIMFQDFTSVAPDSLPMGVSGTSGSGFVTTAKYEVMPDYTKNCLLVSDTDHTTAYSGVQADVLTGNQKGMVGVEIRYKYLPNDSGNSTYSSLALRLYDSNGDIISMNSVAAANGNQFFNYGGQSQTTVEGAKITTDVWYTASWIVDFEAQRVEFKLLNEATGTVSYALDSMYYSSGLNSTELAKVAMRTEVYGGNWIFDYVRVSDEPERMTMSANIQKGVPIEKTAGPVSAPLKGRINILVNGRYMYTTAAPYLKDNGAVMITLKNMAGFLNAQYTRNGKQYIIRLGDKTLVINADKGGEGISTYEEKGNQLFVSAEEVCTMLGCTYSYNEENQTVSVILPQEVGK